MAVQINPVRGRAEYFSDNSLSPVEADAIDDKDVCGIVYIAAESSGVAWPQKPSQEAGNAPLVAHCEHPGPSPPRKRRRRIIYTYAVLGSAVLLAIIIGAAVGSRKQHHASTTPSADTAAAAAASAAAAEYAKLVNSVPFSVRTVVIPPAGGSNYSCQHMFGTMQAIRTYKAVTAAAYAAQLTALNATSLQVTNVTCNGVSYQLPPATMAAAAAPPSSTNYSPLASRRKLQQQQQQQQHQSVSATSALEILTEIEIMQIQEHISVVDISVSKESPWMIECRGSVVDASQVVMPTILKDIFHVNITASSIQVMQLPGIIESTATIITTTSSSASDGSTSINGSAVAAAVAQTIVTQVMTDPFTGYAVDTQVTALPAASTSNASTTTTTSSSSSDHNAADHSTNANEPSADGPTTSSTSNHTPAAAACLQGCDLHKAVSDCVDGRCIVSECTPGWEDCDNLAENGCEMDVLNYKSDNAHCGGCARLCEAPLICSQGVCNMPAAAADNSSSSSGSADSSGKISGEPAGPDHQQQQQQQPPTTAAHHSLEPQHPSPSSNTSSSSNTTSVPAKPPITRQQQQQQQVPNASKPSTSKQPPKSGTVTSTTTNTTASTTTKPSKPTIPATNPQHPAPIAANTSNVTVPAQSTAATTPPKPPVQGKTPNMTKPTPPAAKPKVHPLASTPAKHSNDTKPVKPNTPDTKPKPPVLGKTSNITKPTVPATRSRPPARTPNATVPAKPAAPTPKIPMPTEPPTPVRTAKPPAHAPAPPPTSTLNITIPAKPTATIATPKPSTSSPALAPQPAVLVPAAMRPTAPPVTTVIPQQPPAAAVQPQPALFALPESIPLLYDDLARLPLSESILTIDVLANDNLGALNPSDITLSLLIQPAGGTARVVQGKSKGSPGSADSWPKIEYTATTPVSPGHAVEMYYTIKVRGVKNEPAPATVTILGAYTRPNPSLLDCSPTSRSIEGTPVQSLSHADDTTASLHLPFSVKLYGSEYTTVTISSNGWVSFGSSRASEPCNVVGAWPGAPCLGSGPVLAVFWDDLVTDTVVTYHDKTLGAFIIQWTNVMISGRNTPVGTFQAYVFANGTLGYVYRDLFGSDEALGGGAIIGVRGPSSHQNSFAELLRENPYSNLGATFDPHGSWLWASSTDIPDYVMTTSAQIRSLTPGLALISYLHGVQGNLDLDQASSPGSFKPWILDPKLSLPLLVSPNSPARPTLLQPVSRLSPGDNGLLATIAWNMPPHSPTVQHFRLYVAADALFSELLRQPAGNAFDHDIAGSTRSIDVALQGRFKGRSVYVLVMACYENVCSKSCIGLFTLRPQAET